MKPITHAVLKGVVISVEQDRSPYDHSQPIGPKRLVLELGEHTLTMGSPMHVEGIIGWIESEARKSDKEGQ